jgi:hypothetical protein
MTRKSVWAVVAGVLFIIVVTTLVDVVLHAIGVFPPMDQPLSDSLALLTTVVATWNRRLGPRWYPVALAVLATPQCWVGGSLYLMQVSKR